MPEANTLTAEEKDAGFRLLFDGKTTAGWRGYRRETMFPQWQVIEGALTLVPDTKPDHGHDIVSVEQFTCFELRLDWKLGMRGNSGVMYHVRETANAPYETGPEIQLLDDLNHPDAKNGPERRAGACYAMYAPTVSTVRPVGEWNELKVIVDGDHVEHHLNGRMVVDYVLGSEDWNRRVKASKFVDWKGYASERQGHLCLQDHTDRVAFRNIRIRPV
ncbi:MAG: hypothetical protein JWM57_1632 [Phycisphaerales bacterium]|nr:hypothetical protein [Phycisphaerales bacterium]